MPPGQSATFYEFMAPYIDRIQADVFEGTSWYLTAPIILPHSVNMPYAKWNGSFWVFGIKSYSY